MLVHVQTPTLSSLLHSHLLTTSCPKILLFILPEDLTFPSSRSVSGPRLDDPHSLPCHGAKGKGGHRQASGMQQAGPLAYNLQFQRQRATGPLPCLEATQRPHPVPTVQLAAMTPALLNSTAGRGGREGQGKTHPLRVSARVLPTAASAASLLPAPASRGLGAPSNYTAPGHWGLRAGKNSPRLSCGLRGRAAAHRPGLQRDTRGAASAGCSEEAEWASSKQARV